MLAGISSYTLPWAVGREKDTTGKLAMVHRLLQLAADHACNFLQIGDNLPLDIFTDQDISELIEKAAALNIGIQAGTRGFAIGNTRRYLQLARRLSSPFLRMVIDDENYHPQEKEVVRLILELLPELRESKVILAIENHDRFPAAVLKRIIEQTDAAWVGICLDTANSLGAGEGVEQVVQVLAPYTVNLHVKDVTITRLGHKMGFCIEGAAAGEGMLDIQWIIHEINQYGRCKTATIEIWSGELSSVEETVKREMEWAGRSIRYLKTIIA